MENEEEKSEKVSTPYHDFLVERIKDLLHERRMSLDEICNKSGVSRSYLGRVIAKTSVPSLTVLSQLADGFDLPLCELLNMPETFQLGVKAGYKRVMVVVPEDFDEAKAASGEYQEAENAYRNQQKNDSQTAPANDFMAVQRENAQYILLSKILESQYREETAINKLQCLITNSQKPKS
jgi:transcriptional regulator with XRE-family HTH domain